MLKLTQNSSEIFELSINYAKNFLVVAFFVGLAFTIVFVLVYEHISLEANLSKDMLKVSHFRFWSGSKVQEFRLSSIESVNLGEYSSRSRSQKFNYEKPILVFKNGEYVELLGGKRQVGFSSSFADKFNTFLHQRNKPLFQTKEIYIGIMSAIILGILGVFLPILLALALFIGNHSFVFDKPKSTYFIKYSSPLKTNKKGNLSDIKSVLLVSKVKSPTFEKQAGLHLGLTGQTSILIISAVINTENPTEGATQIRQNAEKLAHFLGVEVREEQW